MVWGLYKPWDGEKMPSIQSVLAYAVQKSGLLIGCNQKTEVTQNLIWGTLCDNNELLCDKLCKLCVFSSAILNLFYWALEE